MEADSSTAQRKQGIVSLMSQQSPWGGVSVMFTTLVPTCDDLDSVLIRKGILFHKAIRSSLRETIPCFIHAEEKPGTNQQASWSAFLSSPFLPMSLREYPNRLALSVCRKHLQTTWSCSCVQADGMWTQVSLQLTLGLLASFWEGRSKTSHSIILLSWLSSLTHLLAPTQNYLCCCKTGLGKCTLHASYSEEDVRRLNECKCMTLLFWTKQGEPPSDHVRDESVSFCWESCNLRAQFHQLFFKIAWNWQGKHTKMFSRSFFCVHHLMQWEADTNEIYFSS